MIMEFDRINGQITCLPLPLSQGLPWSLCQGLVPPGHPCARVCHKGLPKGSKGSSRFVSSGGWFCFGGVWYDVMWLAARWDEVMWLVVKWRAVSEVSEVRYRGWLRDVMSCHVIMWSCDVMSWTGMECSGMGWDVVWLCHVVGCEVMYMIYHEVAMMWRIGSWCGVKYIGTTTPYKTVLHSATKCYSVLQSEQFTLYHKVLQWTLQYYNVLRSITKVLSCTTKVLLYYIVTSLYYKVLQGTTKQYSVPQRNHSVLQSTINYVLKYYSTTKLDSVLQSSTLYSKVLLIPLHDVQSCVIVTANERSSASHGATYWMQNAM